MRLFYPFSGIFLAVLILMNFLYDFDLVDDRHSEFWQMDSGDVPMFGCTINHRVINTECSHGWFQPVSFDVICCHW